MAVTDQIITNTGEREQAALVERGLVTDQTAHDGGVALGVARLHFAGRFLTALGEISDGADGIEVRIEDDATGRVPGDDIGIGGASVTARRVPAVIIVQIKRDERAVVDFLVVGLILGEKIGLEAARVFVDATAVRRRAAQGGNRRGGDGRIDAHAAPSRVVIVIPTPSAGIVGGNTRAENGAQLFFVDGRVGNIATVKLSDRAKCVVFAEIEGVADRDVIGGGRGALLVDDQRDSRERGVTQLQEILDRNKNFRAIGEHVVDRQIIFLIPVRGVSLIKVALVMTRREHVVGATQGAF